MNRQLIRVVIGSCARPPTAAMWQELEQELEELRRQRIYGVTLKDLLDTVRVRRAIREWKTKHLLEPGPDIGQ